MSEEEIIKKVCEMMDVKYHHYDNHKMSGDYFPFNTLKEIPKIVVYSEQYGMWQFAILEDMSILTRTSGYLEILIHLMNVIKISGELEEDQKKKYEEIVTERDKYLSIQKWLKDNEYDKVINNPDKKINWC